MDMVINSYLYSEQWAPRRSILQSNLEPANPIKQILALLAYCIRVRNGQGKKAPPAAGSYQQRRENQRNKMNRVTYLVETGETSLLLGGLWFSRWLVKRTSSMRGEGCCEWWTGIVDGWEKEIESRDWDTEWLRNPQFRDGWNWNFGISI